MGRYIPLMQKMGLQVSEAWHTAYGDAPNRLIGFVCENEQTMNDLLEDALPNVQRKTFQTTGHMGPISHAPEFVRVVRAFLFGDDA